MIKNSMIIGAVLVQGLMVFGAENTLRKSASDLRKSSDKLPTAELDKTTTVPALVASMHYDGGCISNWKNSDHYPHPQRGSNLLARDVAPTPMYQDFPGVGYTRRQ